MEDFIQLETRMEMRDMTVYELVLAGPDGLLGRHLRRPRSMAMRSSRPCKPRHKDALA